MSNSEKQTEKKHFQADVSKLLHIVTHSLYSEKEIFLRELLSNAADACDRLKYRALTDDKLSALAKDFRIVLFADKEKKTLTIADNGLGMSRDEMMENLGTIARSGTEKFLQEMEQAGDKSKSNLIGKFGVGFYSSFIVADKVSVISCFAGNNEAYKWESDGIGEFEISSATRVSHGTSITLHLKEDCEEFLEEARLEYIVKTYSNYLPIAVMLTEDKEYEEKLASCEGKRLNEATALWLKNKQDVKEEEYKEFYHQVAHAYDDPLSTLHFRVEGTLNYRGLLFVPGQRPFDLFHAERMSRVKLYSNRVFITDECEELIPRHLRFLRGVIDCEDLSLNVSREMLQNNAMIAKIRSDVTKRLLKDLQKIKKDQQETFEKFWDAFGIVLKEGLCDPVTDKESLLSLTAFYSRKNIDKACGLDDYIDNMKEGQKFIYYIAGDQKESLLRSPQLESLKKYDIDVLFMLDPVDEFWIPTVGKYKDFEFKSVTSGDMGLEDLKSDTSATQEETSKNTLSEDVQEAFLTRVKEVLKDQVADVRYSERLVDSAVCLVAQEGALDMHMERLLKDHNRLDQMSKKVLELNKDHPILVSMMEKKDMADDDISLLLDQAYIAEGEMPKDRSLFVERLQKLMMKTL